jgi:hypothetical protein
MSLWQPPDEQPQEATQLPPQYERTELATPFQPQYPQPENPYANLPPPPPVVPRQPTQNILTRKVTVPVWAIIVTLLVVMACSGSIGASSNQSSTTANQDNQTTTPTTDNTSSTTDNSTTLNQQETQPTATPVPPTPTPTPKPLKWTTVQTFTGSGNEKTPTFSVPGDWKMLWSCPANAVANEFGQYNLQVDVDYSDGSYADPGAINELCSSRNLSGMTEERVSGDVYLDITSEDAWTIQIQELK